MQALKALATPEAVDAAIIKVAADHEGAANEGAITLRADVKRVPNVSDKEAEAVEVASEDRAN